MIRFDSGLRSLTGDPLEGDRLGYNIYLDEAGTSKNEPVRVVVGVIVNTDEKWLLAEKEVASCFEMVPEHYRADFSFHAKSIWGDKRFRDNWPLADRIAFLKRFMGMPCKLGIPFAVGTQRSGSFDKAFMDSLPKGIKDHQWDHISAFGHCLERIDFYLRHYCDEGQIGTLIAEDVPEIKQYLKRLVKGLKQKREVWISEAYATDRPDGLNESLFGVTQIIDTIHFVDKSEGPLLQIADAIAFAFRRWLAGEQHGEDFVRATTTPEGAVQLKWDNWQGPSSGALLRHGIGTIQRWYDPSFSRRIIY